MKAGAQIEPAPVSRLRLPQETRSVIIYLLLALLVSVPCIWQPHIQANDLSSHLYNAWLVNQVSVGQLKGLYVVPQFTNVLFDHLLSFLLRSGGVWAAEHVAVLAAVQIFFWGCFTFVSTLARRRNWAVAPFLMMLAYGAVFRMGFFNFYISVGICLWALALMWRNQPGVRLLAIPLLLVAYIAHSIPCVWALGMMAYVMVARRLRPSQRVWLMAAGVLALPGLALYLRWHVPSRWALSFPWASLLGTDQLLTFGPKYKMLAAGLFCMWILLLIRRFEIQQHILGDLAVQLWVLCVAACLFMPDAILLRFYSGSLTYITMRLSLLSAILLCATIAVVRFNVLETVIPLLLLALFFSFTYVDERAIGLVEEQMAKATAGFPIGTRFVSTLKDSRLFVPALEHLMDRVCIGRCISFGNYEAATTQFRLRTERGNSYEISDAHDATALEYGEYVWQRRDIDLYRLYPCEQGGSVCAALVKPGERLMKQEITAVPVWWASGRKVE